MSAERDELAEVISDALGVVTGIFDTTNAEDQELAGKIIAAGYRKPQQITTVEELDALPAGTIILDSDPDALLKTDYGTWRSLSDPEEPFKSLYLSLPATVLHAEGAE